MRSAIAPIIFLVSIGVSFINLNAAYATWIVLMPVLVIVLQLEQNNKKKAT